MSSIFAWVRNYTSTHGNTLLALIVASYVLRKLTYLRQSKSSFHRLPAPDAELQPQFIVNTLGMWLHTRYWPVVSGVQPRAVLYLSHGYGEHSGRYEHVAQQLASRGIAVLAVDHQGHGQSQGTRAYAERFKHYLNDFVTFRRLADEKHQELLGLPRFCFGHSFGGCVAIHLMPHCAELNDESLQWAGLILSAPAIAPQTATPVNRFLGSVFSILLPRLGVQALSAKDVSRVPSVVSHYDDDRLNYTGKMLARWGTEVIAACDAVPQIAPQLVQPLLLLHGSADAICQPSGTKALYANATRSKDKTIKIFDQARHELHNDLCSGEEIQLIADWILQRCD